MAEKPKEIPVVDAPSKETPEEKVDEIAEAAAARDTTGEITIEEGQPDPIPKTLHFELRGDKKDGWNWVLWAANHRAIATNPKPYKRRNDAERAIRRMRDESATARIVVATM